MSRVEIDITLCDITVPERWDPQDAKRRCRVCDAELKPHVAHTLEECLCGLGARIRVLEASR